MSFDEVRFNDQMIIYNTAGGAGYNTKIVETNGGKEQRNAVWLYPRAKYQFNDRMVLEDEKNYILNFFHARGGMERGFRYKDWADYKDDGIGVLNDSSVGNATSTAQMFKRYTSGSAVRYKKILKPVSPTVQVKIDGVSASGTLDYTTGIYTFNAITKTISSATPVGTTSFTLTITAHGFLDQDIVILAMAGGTWATKNGPHSLSVIDADNISIAGNASGLGSFSTGTATWYPQARNQLTWTGEYDTPVRFDTDEISFELRAAEVVGYGELGEKAFNFSGVSMVELK